MMNQVPHSASLIALTCHSEDESYQVTIFPHLENQKFWDKIRKSIHGAHHAIIFYRISSYYDSCTPFSKYNRTPIIIVSIGDKYLVIHDRGNRREEFIRSYIIHQLDGDCAACVCDSGFVGNVIDAPAGEITDYAMTKTGMDHIRKIGDTLYQMARNYFQAKSDMMELLHQKMK